MHAGEDLDATLEGVALLNIRPNELQERVAQLNLQAARLNLRTQQLKNEVAAGAGGGWLLSPASLADKYLVDEDADAWWPQAQETVKFNSVSLSEEDQKYVAGPASSMTWHTVEEGSEAVVQAMSKARMKNVARLLACRKLHYVDTHEHKVLVPPGARPEFGTKPDFVIVDGHVAPDPEHVDQRRIVNLGDWKAAGENVTNRTHAGKLLNDMQLVLAAQPTRAWATGCLIVGRRACCYKLWQDRTAIRSRVWDLTKRDHSLWVAGFLLDRASTGYQFDAQHADAGELLGVGATAAVFAHNREASCVLKMATFQHDLKGEYLVLRQLPESRLIP